MEEIFKFQTLKQKLYLIITAIILCAIGLTFISMLGLCSEACKEGHKYLLLGYPFEYFGLLFFSTVGAIHFFQRHSPSLLMVETLFFSSALGAEAYFIYVQKFLIGAWCPVCVAIASCVLLGTAILVYQLFSQEQTMSKFFRTTTVITPFLIGLIVAFLGTAEYNALDAAEDAISKQIAFGNQSSPIEVYLFSDWACPACRRLDPKLEELSKGILPKAKLVFVDHVVHPETLNFVPYHLSFVLKNKERYFPLRAMLSDLSEVTGSPTEDEIAERARRLGVKYEELNYADVAMAIKYYKALGEKFDVRGTPTMVIINRETKKGKKLAGSNEITRENIAEALNQLQ